MLLRSCQRGAFYPEQCAVAAFPSCRREDERQHACKRVFTPTAVGDALEAGLWAVDICDVRRSDGQR